MRGTKHVFPNLADLTQFYCDMYGTFQLNFRHFNRIGLGLRGHAHVQGADFSCLRLKLADMVLI